MKENKFSVSLSTKTVDPLPVVEEVWSLWTGGKEELLKFNARASLGIDKFHDALLAEQREDGDYQFTLQSPIFDSKLVTGFAEMNQLLDTIKHSVLHRMFPMTCCST